MTTLSHTHGLYAWTLTLDGGETRVVVGSSMETVIGHLPVISAVRGGLADQLPAPTVTSLVPPSAKIGDPNFTIHVHGTNFGPGAVIVFAGQDEPTTFVSATELTTGVNMAYWHGPDPAIPVAVRSVAGVLSNEMPFDMQPAAEVGG